MTDRVRRDSPDTRRKRSVLVLISGLVLATIGVACLINAVRVPTETYLCDGESPRACTCYRSGKEPSGFNWNRISSGPEEGLGIRVLIAAASGSLALILWGTLRLFFKDQGPTVERPRLRGWA